SARPRHGGQVNRWLAAATSVVVISAPLCAAAAPQLSTQVSSRHVEVGQEFTVQLNCLVAAGDGSPSDPRLAVPRGLQVRGPSLSTQQNVSIINGQIQQQSGLVATWVLSASATGNYRVGPPTISVNGRVLSGQAVSIEVTPRGSVQQPNRGRRRMRGFDPFDPFGGADPFSGPMFPPGMNLLPEPNPQPEELPTYPSDLNVQKARDPIAFLDARLSSNRVVVGEQLTLRIYAYGKPGPFELMVSTEPSRNDFLSYQNERDNPIGPLYRIKLDSDVWFARKILSYALFPTKTGRLAIGEAIASFAGAGLFGGNQYRNIQRSSQALEVTVDEPPVAGRPPGYHLGDVGQFKINATVEPRQIHVGESISVQVEVSGVGQLPQRLDPPEQSGLDWLEPTVTQQIDDQRDRIAGNRNFTYIVRIDREGTVDLGTLRFPFFDPTTRKYEVPTVALGSVKVAPALNANANAGTAASGTIASINRDDPLLAALQPRKQLRQVGGAHSYWADRPGFFWWLGVGPVLSLSLFALRAGHSRLRKLRAHVATSTKTLLDAERKAARHAIETNQPLQAAASVERLVHLLIEHSVGLRSRAILRAELPPQLEQRGVESGLARQLVDVLERSDNIRFVQGNLEDAKALVTDADNLVNAMLPTLKRKRETA
ncbi:MAG TPA: BatD family protein, partial [Polyangiaceae bacterium]